MKGEPRMSHDTPSVTAEFSGVDLGDKRRNRRLIDLVGKLEERPAESFPKALGTEARTEAMYRFLENKDVHWSTIFDGHVDHTIQRSVAAQRILCVHDTSTMAFPGEVQRTGLFPSTKGKHAYLGHTALAISADGARRPLGLLGYIPVVRPAEGEEIPLGTSYDNESHRWIDLVDHVEGTVPDEVDVVHVMDREGDAYQLLSVLTQYNASFVIRQSQNRRILDPGGLKYLKDHLPTAKRVIQRAVKISKRGGLRPPQDRRIHPDRLERHAKLELRCVSDVCIRRPDRSTDELSSITVNLVHVVEPDPPKGEPAIDWLLLTSMPVSTSEQVEEIVDFYRARWIIEEFFKALKTGCSYTKRQLESLDTLLVAFAMLAPIAWKLLALRWMSRNEPNAPASVLFTADQLVLLRRLDGKRKKGLGEHPTTHEAMMAVARLGGFLSQNKLPGWQILGRGLTHFLTVYEGWKVAMSTTQDGV